MEKDIAENNIDEIIHGIFCIAEGDDDPDYSEKLCLRLAEHEHPDVRAAAILGFGFIARVHRRTAG